MNIPFASSKNKRVAAILYKRARWARMRTTHASLSSRSFFTVKKQETASFPSNKATKTSKTPHIKCQSQYISLQFVIVYVKKTAEFRMKTE